MLRKSLSDPELVLAIINNDEQAFNELFERHWARVYTVAYKIVKDQEIAQEITHDIFLNIWNKRGQLHINSFKSYVTTAASYHGIRKRQALKAVPVNYVENFELSEVGMLYSGQRLNVNAGETNLASKEFNLEIDELLNALPKRCREIYLLSRRDELSITEIAAQLNISKRTVENQLTHALKHLRTSLKYGLLVFMFLKG